LPSSMGSSSTSEESQTIKPSTSPTRRSSMRSRTPPECQAPPPAQSSQLDAMARMFAQMMLEQQVLSAQQNAQPLQPTPGGVNDSRWTPSVPRDQPIHLQQPSYRQVGTPVATGDLFDVRSEAPARSRRNPSQPRRPFDELRLTNWRRAPGRSERPRLGSLDEINGYLRSAQTHQEDADHRETPEPQRMPSGSPTNNNPAEGQLPMNHCGDPGPSGALWRRQS
jgi:hypothetical protein